MTDIVSLGGRVASVLELLAIAVICAGIAYASALALVMARRTRSHELYTAFRQNLARAILLGLEILVAADIIGTVAVDPTWSNVGVLGVIVLIRTTLSWTLEVEIDGMWPWQRHRLASGADRDPPPPT